MDQERKPTQPFFHVLFFVVCNNAYDAFLELDPQLLAFMDAPRECVPLYKYFEENYTGKRNRGRSLNPRKKSMFAHTQWNVHERTMDGMQKHTTM